MFIEDLIKILSISVAIINKWDRLVIISLDDQLTRQLGFTEKQKKLALTLIRKHSNILSTYLRQDITPYLDSPTYKYGIRQINGEKKISITSYRDYFKAIKLEFPYNEHIINHIKANKQKLQDVNWDSEEKAWFFRLTEGNILYIMELLNEEKFKLDEEIENYISQTDKIIKNIENYLPMLCFSENRFFYKNSHANLPQVQSTDFLSAVFEARKNGIFTWDDEISNFINSDQINPLTRELLKSSSNEKLRFSHENYTITDLTDIIKYLAPTIFVIPGGNEFEKLTFCYEFLQGCGIDNQNISVLFRLPSETGHNFNEFVKNNQLNTPLTENTKVVIISGKIPKPLIKSKIKFHSIINLGYDNVHYTMRDFVQKHENLMYFSEKTNHRGFNFGNM